MNSSLATKARPGRRRHFSGRVVESGLPREVLSAPQEDRTKAFLSTVL